MDVSEVDARDPDLLHENVEGLDPHDGGRGDPAALDVDAAVGPVLGEVDVELDVLLNLDLALIVDDQSFDLEFVFNLVILFGISYNGDGITCYEHASILKFSA